MKGREKEKVKDRQKEKVKLFRPPNLTDQIFEYSPNVAEMIWYTRIWTVDLPFRIIMTRNISSPSSVVCLQQFFISFVFAPQSHQGNKSKKF